MDEPGAVPDPPDPEPGETAAGAPPRRYPSTLGGAFYLVVLATTVVGLVVASTGSWRQGVRWIGAALLLAAVVRLLLRPQDAGMLAVRHRPTDVTLLAVVGALLIFLAFSIPDQPG